jgi:hypothetical protein
LGAVQVIGMCRPQMRDERERSTSLCSICHNVRGSSSQNPPLKWNDKLELIGSTKCSLR